MTWTRATADVAAIKQLMLESHEAYVDYTMPLGLHHLIGGDHYAPMPENPDPRRADWSAIYYHRADSSAIGFDRTRRGSAAVDQYRAPLRDEWNDPEIDAGDAAPLVSPAALGLPASVWRHALGGPGPALFARRQQGP